LKRFATIVSGVPRSGASAVMQMLGAGGMALLVDGARPADADNPRGYFEFAPVRASARDASWFAHAVGRAVKVVHALLAPLPADVPARVLMLRRDLGEVLASQRAMLERAAGGAPDPAEDELLRAAFTRQLEEACALVASRGAWQLLEIEHARLLADPDGVAGAVADFLGGGLDTDAMARVIDPGLYRQRFV